MAIFFYKSGKKFWTRDSHLSCTGQSPDGTNLFWERDQTQSNFFSGLESGFFCAELHFGGPRQGRELRQLLLWRRETLPHLWGRRPTSQNLGLPEQELCPDTGRPQPEHILRHVPPRAPNHLHRI